jgi:secreted trypsin-like serine protease
MAKIKIENIKFDFLTSRGQSPGQVNVIAGTLENGNGGTTHDVVSIIIHEDYGTDGFAHDIAVWEVSDLTNS